MAEVKYCPTCGEVPIEKDTSYPYVDVELGFDPDTEDAEIVMSFENYVCTVCGHNFMKS